MNLLQIGSFLKYLQLGFVVDNIKYILLYLGLPALRASGSGKQIKVITGHGKHSERGAKIKPAIIAYLKQRKYK